jgi:hypothetical protein
VRFSFHRHIGGGGGGGGTRIPFFVMHRPRPRTSGTLTTEPRDGQYDLKQVAAGVRQAAGQEARRSPWG